MRRVFCRERKKEKKIYSRYTHLVVRRVRLSAVGDRAFSGRRFPTVEHAAGRHVGAVTD